MPGVAVVTCPARIRPANHFHLGAPSPWERCSHPSLENTMHTTCSDSVGPAQDHATIDLEELLGDGEAQLVYEGLYRLREAKVEALGIVRAAGLSPHGRPFEPWDFGVPQIDRLLGRLGADPVEASPATPEC